MKNLSPQAPTANFPSGTYISINITSSHSFNIIFYFSLLFLFCIIIFLDNIHQFNSYNLMQVYIIHWNGSENIRSSLALLAFIFSIASCSSLLPIFWAILYRLLLQIEMVKYRNESEEEFIWMTLELIYEFIYITDQNLLRLRIWSYYCYRCS